MIDIHTHILPGIDDGAPDMETSLEMAAMAADSGVEYLVATPHCSIPGLYQNYCDESFIKCFRKLKAEVEDLKIPIKLLIGMEIFVTEELPELLKKKKVIGLNGTKNLLVEFAFDEDPFFCHSMLKECKKLGYTPIIAHPERYYFVQRYPDVAFDWHQDGYILQINKGSILGKFGRTAKAVANLLLEEEAVGCVASDAHSSWSRTTHMSEVREYLQMHYGRRYAEKVLEKNPKIILSGRKIEG